MNEDLILEQIMKLREDVGSMKTSLDTVATTITTHVTEDKTIHEAQDKRISELEKTQSRVKYIAIGAGGVMAGLWEVVKLAFTSNGPHN